MGVDVAVAIPAAGVDAEVVLVALGQQAAVGGDHVRPDLVDVGAVGVVHHVRRIAARGAHVDLKAHKVALAAQAGLVLRELEELQVHKAAARAEGLNGGAAQRTQRLGNVGRGIIGQVLFLVDDVHDGRGPGGHGLKQRLAARVGDGVVGEDVALHEFLHHIGDGGQVGEEAGQVAVVLELVGGVGAHAVVGLDDDGIAHLPDEGLGGVPSGDVVAAGGGHACAGVVGLHAGLALEGGHLVAVCAGGDVEVSAQAGVLLQPVFVVGLQPVDLAVLEGEEGHRAEHLVIAFHVVHAVILGQRGLEAAVEAVVGRVADAQHVDAAQAQPVAEGPVGVRKMRRDKYKVHIVSSSG